MNARNSPYFFINIIDGSYFFWYNVTKCEVLRVYMCESVITIKENDRKSVRENAITLFLTK